MANLHLTDEELLLAADGEISPERQRHLSDCPACRPRRRLLEDAAAEAARIQHASTIVSSPESARARLQARLHELPHQPPARIAGQWRLAATLLACALGVAILFHRAGRLPEIPSRRLTPGAARLVSRDELCSAPLPKNQVVPAELRQRVAEAYGIAHADPGEYEVDYLITPALGGVEDIRNLWPEPYASTVWNARVKDQLEDRLHELVCGGRLDLAAAQRDISTDWIAAYKKYFGTAEPK